MHRDHWNHVELIGFDMASTDLGSVEPTLDRVVLRDGCQLDL